MTITVSQHESMDGITDKSLLVFHWYLALGCGYKHELIPSGHATSSNCTRPDTINTRPRRRPSVQLETDRRGIEARLYLSSVYAFYMQLMGAHDPFPTLLSMHDAIHSYRMTTPAKNNSFCETKLEWRCNHTNYGSSLHHTVFCSFPVCRPLF